MSTTTGHDEYDPYKKLDDAKLKSTGDVHRLSKNEVLDDIVRGHLQGDKRPADEFSAIVRKVVTYDDSNISNADPFYSTDDDKERMLDAGKIKDVKTKIAAYVEVPSFFVPVTNMKVCTPSEYYLPLLRVDISKTGKKGERAVKLNELIIIKFGKNFTNPRFAKYPKEKPVMLESDLKTKKKGATAADAFNFQAGAQSAKKKCKGA
jgi:hypothetical protein